MSKCLSVKERILSARFFAIVELLKFEYLPQLHNGWGKGFMILFPVIPNEVLLVPKFLFVTYKLTHYFMSPLIISNLIFPNVKPMTFCIGKIPYIVILFTCKQHLTNIINSNVDQIFNLDSKPSTFFSSPA